MRVAVVGVLAESIVSFRGEMLRAMAAQGHEVLAMAPEDDAAVRATLAQMGVAYTAVPMRRAGLNPLRDAATVVALTRAFRRFGAETVLVYAAKPVAYGSIAARLAGVPHRAAMITGVGSVLEGGGGARRRLLATALRSLYRIGLRQVQLIFFQNPDDVALFRGRGLIREGTRVVLINGSGVDLDRFALAPLPGGPMTFLMASRIIGDKGVLEYVEAARIVRRQHPEVRVQLVGALDPNPSAIPASQLEAWQQEGAIEYLGLVPDVRPALAAAHVLVLPSYGEGTPRSVLEAMAMGRPIVTTDVPGCRQTVDPGVNGILVPARDARALADAMLTLVDSPEMLPVMGAASRRLAEERFDVHDVNRVILDAMGLRGVPANGG